MGFPMRIQARRAGNLSDIPYADTVLSMAKPEQLPNVTRFSKALGVGLAAVMRDRGITQTRVASLMGRNQGYVSERLNGLRPIDADMIAAVALAARTRPFVIAEAALEQTKGIVADEAEVLTPSPRSRGRAGRKPGPRTPRS